LNKIFGLGLSKTGTTSLNQALNQLGYRTLHFPSDGTTESEIYQFLKGTTQQLRLTILDSYDGITDQPVCPIYKALDRSYPGSKFIMTVREKQDWLRSCAKHWKAVERQRALAPQRHADWGYIDYIRKVVYGTTQYDTTIFSAVYDTHYQDVFNYFSCRQQDLLVLDVVRGSGWDALCPFLGVNAPEAPFPWLNRSAPNLGEEEIQAD